MRLRYESRLVPAGRFCTSSARTGPVSAAGSAGSRPSRCSCRDVSDFQEAQILRQKTLACFAAFRVSPDADPQTGGADPGGLSSLTPGQIQNLAQGEDIRFAMPPGVEAYDEFTAAVLRSVAAGMGITYEALTGDLNRVNFSSARIGRMEWIETSRLRNG